MAPSSTLVLQAVPGGSAWTRAGFCSLAVDLLSHVGFGAGQGPWLVFDWDLRLSAGVGRSVGAPTLLLTHMHTPRGIVDTGWPGQLSDTCLDSSML